MYLQQCRALKDEGREEKETENERNGVILKENELNLKKERGFWSSFRDVIFKDASRDSQYSEAVARVEKVFSSVSFLSFHEQITGLYMGFI